MSDRRKGNRFQTDIAAWLRDRGWTVRNFPVTVQPRKTPRGLIYCGQKLDVWGADLVARKGGRLLWIQASCSGGIKKRAEEFLDYFSFMLPGEELQIWIKARPGIINVTRVLLDKDPAKVGKIIRGKFYGAGLEP